MQYNSKNIHHTQRGFIMEGRMGIDQFVEYQTFFKNNIDKTEVDPKDFPDIIKNCLTLNGKYSFYNLLHRYVATKRQNVENIPSLVTESILEKLISNSPICALFFIDTFSNSKNKSVDINNFYKVYSHACFNSVGHQNTPFFQKKFPTRIMLHDNQEDYAASHISKLLLLAIKKHSLVRTYLKENSKKLSAFTHMQAPEIQELYNSFPYLFTYVRKSFLKKNTINIDHDQTKVRKYR